MILFRRRHINAHWIIAVFVEFSLFGWFVNTFGPNSLTNIIIFFAIVFMILFSLSSFLLYNVRRAMLYSLGGTLYLVLRFLSLREIYYSLLLAITIVSIDYYISKSPTIGN